MPPRLNRTQTRRVSESALPSKCRKNANRNPSHEKSIFSKKAGQTIHMKHIHYHMYIIVLMDHSFTNTRLDKFRRCTTPYRSAHCHVTCPTYPLPPATCLSRVVTRHPARSSSSSMDSKLHVKKKSFRAIFPKNGC